MVSGEVTCQFALTVCVGCHLFFKLGCILLCQEMGCSDKN